MFKVITIVGLLCIPAALVARRIIILRYKGQRIFPNGCKY